MKIFGKRSLTAALSVVLNVEFYVAITLTAIFLLTMFIGNLIKPGFIDFIYNLPLVWYGNGIVLEYQGEIELSEISVIIICTTLLCVHFSCLYILFCFKQLFANFRKNIVFSKEQALYIKRIGLLVIILEFVLVVPEVLISGQVVDTLILSDMTMMRFPMVSLSAIFFGMCMIILSYAIEESAPQKESSF